MTKQFIVAWMELGTPTVTGGGSVTAGDCNCAQPDEATGLRSHVPAAAALRHPRSCDPLADNPTHLITATVKGIIPLNANFGEWGLGDHLTMPDDWAKWAAVAARSSLARLADHGRSTSATGTSTTTRRDVEGHT